MNKYNDMAWYRDDMNKIFIRYLGHGVFERTTMTGQQIAQCNCSILYRSIPYNLMEYEAGVMHSELLRGIDPR